MPSTLVKKIFQFFVSKLTFQFPEFTLLSIDDRTTIQKFTEHFPPYSDFNFTSIYSWNVDNSHAYLFYKKNLILRLSDYLTGKPFYTILGREHLLATIKFILNHEQNAIIKLIPAITAETLQTKSLTLKEDRNNFDYIFLLLELKELKGNKYKTKRHLANKCQQQGDINFIIKSHLSKDDIQTIQNVLDIYYTNKGDNLSEKLALERILAYFNFNNNLLMSIAYQNNQVVGFSIDEPVHNGYVMSHYFKTTSTINGLSEYFNRFIAGELIKKGYKYWNWEQDLGIPQLRDMKMRYRPITMLEKYKL